MYSDMQKELQKEMRSEQSTVEFQNAHSKARIQNRSSVSLFASMSFAVFVLLAASMITGCDSESAENDSQNITTPVAPAPPPVASAPVSIPETVIPEIKVVSFEEANFAFREGEYNDAVRLFESYTESNSENPWGHYMLGLSALRLGNFDLAESAFNRSIEIDPTHQKSRLNLARLLLSTDRSEQALENIQVAKESTILTAEVFRMRGRALRSLGRISEAEEAYREAIRLDDKDTWAMNNLALILLDQGFGELAIPALARAAELNPSEPVFQNNLGMALEQTGHFRSAESAYARALELNASHNKALANLARIELVDQDADLSAVDLPALAADFVDEISSWSDENIARELPIAVAISDSINVSSAVSDSTAVEGQQ